MRTVRQLYPIVFEANASSKTIFVFSGFALTLLLAFTATTFGALSIEKRALHIWQLLMSTTIPVAPRDAASLIILRGEESEMHVLMGRRSKTARFMPNYLVFPGGAVDPEDPIAATRAWAPTRFHAAAIRETWEETDVLIGHPVIGKSPPTLCALEAAFLKRGMQPDGTHLVYAARAITPASSPMRFDTRFFVTDTQHLSGTAKAMGELPEVAWLPIATALSHPQVSGVTRFALTESLRRWASAKRRDATMPEEDDPIRIYTYLQTMRSIQTEEPGTGLL